MLKPLRGITVVALEQAVAAPFCTARLADAGARVIKVERPEGDFARGYDQAAAGESSYFVWLNRGKESVVLDLANQADRDVLDILIAGCDVFVQNLKPGALARLGFAVEQLRARYPRLICCSISGYGDRGPYKERKAYDLLIQAESGLCSLTGTPQSAARVGISVVDIAAGVTAYSATLEALLARSISNRGADIRIAMFDVIAEWLTVPLLLAESGKPPQRMGIAHASIAPYGLFTTRDGRSLVISVQSDWEWRNLCEQVLDRPDVVREGRLSTNVDRVRQREQTDDIVASAFRRQDALALINRLSAAGLAFAEMNDMLGLSRHPQLRRVSVRTPNGTVSCPAPAPIIDGVACCAGAVPTLGAHTDEILARVNFPRTTP